MNNIGEFRIDEAKGIRQKIDYIRVSNQQYKNMNYEQLLDVLIQMIIDWNRGTSLEAARLIKFAGDKSPTTKEYRGYTYVVPERDNLKIDKIIKILNVIYGNTELVYVKFIGDPVGIKESKQIKKEQHYKKKLEEEKQLVAEKLFGTGCEISDEDLRMQIASSDDSPESIAIRLENLDRERTNIKLFEMEQLYSHIKWILNDTKQAELFGISLEEYRDNFREKNIQSDILTKTFLDYVKILQSNLNIGYIIEDYVYDNEEFNPAFDDM